MSRAVSELPANGADAPELPPPSRPGWLHRQRHLIGLGLSLLLFGLALLACWHLVREINPDQVRDSLAAVPPRALFAAMLATVLGFLLMLAYEWSASRYADVRLPASTLAPRPSMQEKPTAGSIVSVSTMRPPPSATEARPSASPSMAVT